MALIKCSECGVEISEKARMCPKCGYPVRRYSTDIPWAKKVISKILVIFGCLVVLNFILLKMVGPVAFLLLLPISLLVLIGLGVYVFVSGVKHNLK